MPTSVGPNIFGEENLVFGYDTGDTVNSYRGEPTVNIVPNQTLQWSEYSVDLEQNAIVSPDGDLTGIKMTATATTQVRTEFNLPNPSSSTYYAFSVYAKRGSSPYAGFSTYFPPYLSPSALFNLDTGNLSYTAGTLSTSIKYVRDGWYRLGMVVPVETDQTYRLIKLMQTNSPTNANAGVSGSYVYYYKPQVEEKPYITPFTAGTRSATQGLIDLTGNSTIDLSNVSFDSDAQMTFDGTDDYLTLPDIDTYSSTAKFTIEGVVRAIGGNWSRIFTNGSNGVPGAVTGFINTDLIVSTSSSIPYLTLRVGNIYILSTTQISTNTWSGDDFVMYFAFSANKESRTGTYLFRFGQNNGLIQKELSGTYTPGTATGFVENRLGAETDNESYAQMDMHMFKMYDRELSLEEMRKNYNAIKGRFNI